MLYLHLDIKQSSPSQVSDSSYICNDEDFDEFDVDRSTIQERQNEQGPKHQLNHSAYPQKPANQDTLLPTEVSMMHTRVALANRTNESAHKNDQELIKITQNNYNSNFNSQKSKGCKRGDISSDISRDQDDENVCDQENNVQKHISSTKLMQHFTEYLKVKKKPEQKISRKAQKINQTSKNPVQQKENIGSHKKTISQNKNKIKKELQKSFNSKSECNSAIKKQIKESQNQRKPELEKSPENKFIVINENFSNNFYERQIEFVKKKEQKIKEQKKLKEFQQELQFLEERKKMRKLGVISYQNSSEKLKNEQSQNKQNAKLVDRMESDVQRRKRIQAATQQYKIQNEQQSLKQMFNPKINTQRSESQKKERCGSVYERLNHDAFRRKKSLEVKRYEQEEMEKLQLSQSIKKNRNRSISQHSIEQKSNRSHSKTQQEAKLRDALTLGVSAIELWKLLGDDTNSTISRIHSMQTSERSIQKISQNPSKTLNKKDHNQKIIIKNASFKQIGCVDKRVCDSFSSNSLYSQVSRKLEGKKKSQETEEQQISLRNVVQPKQIVSQLNSPKHIDISSVYSQSVTSSTQKVKAKFLIENEAKRHVDKIISQHHFNNSLQINNMSTPSSASQISPLNQYLTEIILNNNQQVSHIKQPQHPYFKNELQRNNLQNYLNGTNSIIETYESVNNMDKMKNL